MKEATRRTIGPTAVYRISNRKKRSSMKRRLDTLGETAIYDNEAYEFRYRSDENRCAIFSYQAKSDLENGFFRLGLLSDRLVKYVSFEDLDFVFEKETTAIYSGGTFLVSAIERKEVCLHTSDCALAEKYGMEERNAGEYHMRVKLNEVEEITQKWIPLGEYKQQSPESNRQTNGRFRTSGKTAIYRNTEYEFFYDIEKNRCAIISYRTKSDLENGFSEVDPSSDRLIKYVSLEDLDFVFEKESTAIYKGDLFRADSILTDKIVLSTGDRDLEKKYNMKQWDRGYYFIHANLKDVERITQEWIPLEKYNKHIFAREDI